MVNQPWECYLFRTTKQNACKCIGLRNWCSCLCTNINKLCGKIFHKFPSVKSDFAPRRLPKNGIFV